MAACDKYTDAELAEEMGLRPTGRPQKAPGSVLQALADGGIFFSVECYDKPSDRLWHAVLNDQETFEPLEDSDHNTLAECEAWLTQMAIKHYPDSEFAKGAK